MFKKIDKSNISIMSGKDNKDIVVINKHLNTCFICNKELGKEYNLHHISRVPPIVVRVHKNCHTIIEEDSSVKWEHLKPTYQRGQLRFLKWAYNSKDNLKKLHNDLRFANREMSDLSKRLERITKEKM